MKKFILGFLVGALLFSIIPVGAAVQEYVLQMSDAKLVIDGAEYVDKELPVLNYKGYNYIPAAAFRDICQKIGVNFDWVNDVKEIQIKTSGQALKKEGDMVGDRIWETPDGITQIDAWEGKQYIGIIYIRNKIKEKGYNLIRMTIDERDPLTHEWTTKEDKQQVIKGFYNENLKPGEHQSTDYTVLIDDVPITIVYGHSCVEADYYINTILPLIK